MTSPTVPAGMELDRATVDRLLTTTRAVRRRLDLDRPVDPSVIVECLELAVHAPSAANLQPWRFVVVTDRGQREALAALYARAWTTYRAMVTGGNRARRDPARHRALTASSDHLTRNLARVPVHVLPCAVGRPPADAEGIMAAAYYGSVYPAVWSLQLALRSRGLGSSLTVLHLLYEREAAAILGLPQHVTQLGLIAIGHTDADFGRGPRRPVADVTFWGRWGQTDAPRFNP